MNNALIIEGLNKTYNQNQDTEIRVLKDVNFRLERGEVVGLTAPSGAGKSTLLHIAGLLDSPDPTTKILKINGLNALEIKDDERTSLRRTEIGFIYQFHHLLPEFTALENIILPQLANGVTHKAAKERAEYLLGCVDVHNRSDHRPAALSGGQQQRVAFCRALANSPNILLADEPTGNLDTETAEIVFKALLKIVKDEGICALIATHNIDLAQKMDRRISLENGSLINQS